MWWFSNNDIEVLCTLFLTCPENVCIERIQNRGGDRVDDNIDTIKKRFATNKKESEPIIPELKKMGPSIQLNGMGTPEEVFDLLCKELDKVIK